MNKSRKYTGPWVILILAISIMLVAGPAFAKKSEAETAKKVTVAPTQKTPHGSKALGPQPEPPDRHNPGSKGLGPQPEPPDKNNPSSDSLGPQPEPPDRDIRGK